MATKEECLQKYADYKRNNHGAIPEYRDFLKFVGIDKRQFARVFGASPYSKLQEAAGDVPNKLQMERTPLAKIMHQYGNLVIELGKVPAYSDWDHRGLRPTESGLKSAHGLRWSDIPKKFTEWVVANQGCGLDQAIEIITVSDRVTAKKPTNGDAVFSKLINDVRAWIPARRRNSEEAYKVELRKHLESLSYRLNEEHGESNIDLLIEKVYAIEIKKDPPLSEYDRLFGQTARHLQHQCKVIVLIIDATRGDKYANFVGLVDKYFNFDKSFVEVIAKS